MSGDNDRPTGLSLRQAQSGRDVSSIRFYEVFAHFKVAVVIQQLHFRFVNGQSDDQRFATFGERVTVAMK